MEGKEERSKGERDRDRDKVCRYKVEFFFLLHVLMNTWVYFLHLAFPLAFFLS